MLVRGRALSADTGSARFGINGELLLLTGTTARAGWDRYALGFCGARELGLKQGKGSAHAQKL